MTDDKRAEPQAVDMTVAELRSMLVDVVGAACNAMQDQLGSQIAEVHEAIGSACDRLDVIEGDISATRRQMARVLRERETDRANLAALHAHVRDIERRGVGRT